MKTLQGHYEEVCSDHSIRPQGALWCHLLHIFDQGFEVRELNPREMTDEEWNRYKDYVEIKPEFLGYDYTHHLYLAKQSEAHLGVRNPREKHFPPEKFTQTREPGYIKKFLNRR